MPTTTLSASRTTYLQLVAAIKTEIVAGRRIIQQTQAETYWKVGRFISEYILEGKDRAGYGEETYRRLSKDLNIAQRTLEDAARFSREFSITHARAQLTWTHFRSLLALPDRNSRRALIQKALKRDFNTRELQKEIEARKPFKIDPAAPIPQLKAAPGQFHTYTAVKGPDGRTYLDAGFDIWHDRPSAKPAAKNDYTFRARVESIVDGDTLWAVVDLGYNVFTRQKLRLAGIDCPELEPTSKISKHALEKDQLVLRAEGEARSTALKYPGQAAKRFVQSLIKVGDPVVIKTQKGDDKYGRYLCHLWCGEGEKEIYLNQELLNRRLAVILKS